MKACISLGLFLVGVVVCQEGGYSSPQDLIPWANQIPRTVDQAIQESLNRAGDVMEDEDVVMLDGDMKISKKKANDPTSFGGSGIIGEHFRWTDNTLPYELSSVYQEWEKKEIRAAMDEWERYTCLKFVPRTTQKDYLWIHSGSHCWSWVGMEGGRQDLSLALNGCIYYPTIVHEFGHAIGFHHEHQRTDRDGFITIIPENVEPGFAYFEKYNDSYISTFGVKYDYWSVMHYGVYAFSAGGQTFKPHDMRYNDVIGTTPGVSFQDIKAANILYKCDEQCTNTCPPKAIRATNCDCWCNTGNPGNPTEVWDGKSECKGPDDFIGHTCVDYHEKCEEWAEYGHCDASINYMRTNCKKACRVCGEGAFCQDLSEYCASYDKNYCDQNPGWMKQHCRKLCGTCNLGDTTPPPGTPRPTSKPSQCSNYPLPESQCRDHDGNCGIYASQGQCQNNADWMYRYCPLACKHCGTDLVCQDVRSAADCASWAYSCNSNPGFMHAYCPNTCKCC